MRRKVLKALLNAIGRMFTMCLVCIITNSKSRKFKIDLSIDPTINRLQSFTQDSTKEPSSRNLYSTGGTR